MCNKLFGFFFGKGFSFRVTKDFPGEEKLPPPNTDPDITKGTIQKEIMDSIKKEANDGINKLV